VAVASVQNEFKAETPFSASSNNAARPEGDGGVTEEEVDHEQDRFHCRDRADCHDCRCIGAQQRRCQAEASGQAHRAGPRDGQYPWTEGLKLRAEQNRIAKVEANYKADGYLSTSERRKLRAMQVNASEHIADEKSDGWRRAWWMPRFGR
jgi:hypothetical protein